MRKFEKTTPANSNQVVNKRDGSKPGKKKPKSKAFEEFESSGIIIGMVRLLSRQPLLKCHRDIFPEGHVKWSKTA